ncbi:hypothetical protein DFH94DRAFT_123602 [Russula ochroleuca]|uniref:Uncharacterized protein n=1 Tax=Russula ochroleuca TaxID=152965 RepID=A0A9P5JSQ5_9AGAM|nr:hypothetical protein DFH94DRAFT_123602 [Russula ochroleuca]
MYHARTAEVMYCMDKLKAKDTIRRLRQCDKFDMFSESLDDATSIYPRTGPPASVTIFTSTSAPTLVASPTLSISNPSSTLFFSARPELEHCPLILKARFFSSSFLLRLTLLHLLCLLAQPIRMHGRQTRQSHMQPLTASSRIIMRNAVRALSIFPNSKNALLREMAALLSHHMT